MNEFGLTAAGQSLLTKTRALFSDGQVIVNSGARSTARNATIAGSSRRSQHVGGNAFDFAVERNGVRLSNAEIFERVRSSGLVFGQVIDETGLGMRPRVHLGTGTKGRLSIGRDGRYTDIERGKYRQAINNVLGDRIGNKVSNSLKSGSDILAKGGDQISKAANDLNNYINRGIFGVIGLLFIVGVIYYLIRKN